MGLISLIIKAFFLYVLFSLLIGAWRLFRTFKFIKGQQSSSKNQFEDLFKQRQQEYQNQSSSGSQQAGDVFEAEYRVVKDD